MHHNNGLADLYKRNELNAQLHVGASYTFYNEQSTSKLDERDDVMRAKASSQLDNMKSRAPAERDT